MLWTISLPQQIHVYDLNDLAIIYLIHLNFHMSCEIFWCCDQASPGVCLQLSLQSDDVAPDFPHCSNPITKAVTHTTQRCLFKIIKSL